MRQHPVADRGHRHLLARNYAALDQQSTDRNVGMTVAAIISDLDHSAFVQPDQSRALDFEKERVDRTVDPGQFQSLRPERAVLDFGAAVPLWVRRSVVKRRLIGS